MMVPIVIVVLMVQAQPPAAPQGRQPAAPADWDAAYDKLRQALRDEPDDANALRDLAAIAGQMAQREFQRLFAMAPDSARVHQLMAESLETQDRRTEAEAEYEAALRAKPDLLDALLGLAKLKRVRLACDDATALYAKAEAIRPTFDGAFGLGTCELHTQDDRAALAHFEQAVARDPRAAIAVVGLGTALLRTGRTAEAIAKLRQAIALEPELRDAYYQLGRAYQAAGDRARAQEAFTTAEQLRLKSPTP